MREPTSSSPTSAFSCSGILNLDKPIGITSRTAVDRVQLRCRPLRAGHAGTLDPLASGVLLIAIGQATRLIADLQGLRKTYRAEFMLGQSSESDDLESLVQHHPDAPIPTEVELQQAAVQMTGTIQQRPPRYSALKVNGRRAYDLARRGRAFELEARPVEIYQLRIEQYVFPRLMLRIECGSGTYVRSLGRDLAESVGTKALMSGLQRVAIGPFSLEEAVSWDELGGSPDGLRDKLHPPAAAIANRPMIALPDSQIDRLQFGQSIGLDGMKEYDRLFVTDQQARLRAIISSHSTGCWKPIRVFPLEPTASVDKAPSSSRSNSQ
jgi:tRNA pseudouridine55 synthase